MCCTYLYIHTNMWHIYLCINKYQYVPLMYTHVIIPVPGTYLLVYTRAQGLPGCQAPQSPTRKVLSELGQLRRNVGVIPPWAAGRGATRHTRCTGRGWGGFSNRDTFLREKNTGVFVLGTWIHNIYAMVDDRWRTSSMVMVAWLGEEEHSSSHGWRKPKF